MPKTGQTILLLLYIFHYSTLVYTTYEVGPRNQFENQNILAELGVHGPTPTVYYYAAFRPVLMNPSEVDLDGILVGY